MDSDYVAELRARLESPNLQIANAALDVLGKAQMLQCSEDAMPQVDALIAAGWLFEPVNENSEPWQWYWRAPKKGKRKKGRRYLSTNQAYMALQRISKPSCSNPQNPASRIPD